jgi:hypothetical protein
MDHISLCGIGVNNNISERGTIGKDEEVSLHLGTS